MSVSKSELVVIVAGLLSFAASPAMGAVRYVDADATGPTHDGSNRCNTHLHLQDALAVAVAADEIRVAEGAYMPDGGRTGDAGHITDTGDRTATFQLISGVTIKGGYSGCGAPDPEERDIEGHETILSGDLAGDDIPDLGLYLACIDSWPGMWDKLELHCERVPDGDFAEANIEDNAYHVVTGSGTDNTAVLDGVTVTAGHRPSGVGSTVSPFHGAGMFNHIGNPTVSHCTFVANFAFTAGGGMFNY